MAAHQLSVVRLQRTLHLLSFVVLRFLLLVIAFSVSSSWILPSVSAFLVVVHSELFLRFQPFFAFLARHEFSFVVDVSPCFAFTRWFSLGPPISSLIVPTLASFWPSTLHHLCLRKNRVSLLFVAFLAASVSIGAHFCQLKDSYYSTFFDILALLHLMATVFTSALILGSSTGCIHL
jgi:hypothetical protein